MLIIVNTHRKFRKRRSIQEYRIYPQETMVKDANNSPSCIY
jgi:hypothetical protein